MLQNVGAATRGPVPVTTEAARGGGRGGSGLMQVRREGVGRAVEVVVALVPEEGVGGGCGEAGGLDAGGQGIVGRGVRGGRLRGGLKRDAGLVEDGERQL